MKTLISVFLILVMLLSGCGRSEEVLFYYLRADILYGQADGVIASEARDISGHKEDLSYLLMLYLEGPIEQELISPFPKGTRVIHLEIQGKTLSVTLSESFSDLEGLDYTIACTCIAQTCFGVKNVETVEISSEDRTITLNRDSITLADTATAPGR